MIEIVNAVLPGGRLTLTTFGRKFIEITGKGYEEYLKNGMDEQDVIAAVFRHAAALDLDIDLLQAFDAVLVAESEALDVLIDEDRRSRDLKKRAAALRRRCPASNPRRAQAMAAFQKAARAFLRLE